MENVGINLACGILEWASEGHDVNTISKKFSNFTKWLNGEERPTFKELEKLAKYLDFPFGYFFLPHPLRIEREDNIDYRTIKNKLNYSVSANLKLNIENMKYIQEWEKDYCIRNQLQKIDFTLTSKQKDDINVLTQYIYTFLGIQENWFEKYQNPLLAFNYIRGKIEEKRIIVVVNGKINDNTHKTFDLNEFRAFALYDEYAPLIFINSLDSPTGRLFSLMHELVHIMRGETDVINEVHFSVETLCNNVAIQFLAPEKYIINSIDNFEITKNKITEFSNLFHVSFEAMCYRLYALNYLSKEKCNSYIQEDIDKLTSVVDKRKKTGGNYWNTKLNILSTYVARSIISELYNGNITYTECFKMLGVSGIKTFTKFEEKLAKKKL